MLVEICSSNTPITPLYMNYQVEDMVSNHATPLKTDRL